MKYLLDTNVFLYFLDEDFNSLSEAQKAIIDNNDKIEYLHNKLLEIDIEQFELDTMQNKFKEIVEEINSWLWH